MAWSVFTGYAIAIALLLRSLHPKGWIVTPLDIFTIVFFVVGGFGVYLAFAVPMRWWPHQPRKRNEATFKEIQYLYNYGLQLLKDWGELTILGRTNPAPRNLNSLSKEKNLTNADSRAELLMSDWIPISESRLKELLGDEEGLRYKFSHDLTELAPSWAEESMFPGLWQTVQGRLRWITKWIRDELNL